MSDMKHTQEPWQTTPLVPGAIVSASNPMENLLGTGKEGYAIFMKIEDAERAAACVTACKGMTSDELQTLASEGGLRSYTYKMTKSLEAEVARLREALGLCRPLVEAVRLKQEIPPTEEAYSSMIEALATRQDRVKNDCGLVDVEGLVKDDSATGGCLGPAKRGFDSSRCSGCEFYPKDATRQG